MHPSTLSPPAPSAPAGSPRRVPWPTSDDRPETVQNPAPPGPPGDLRADPDAAVLVMNAGQDGAATPGLVAGDTPLLWGERLRHMVQRRPFMAVTTALALGAVLVRFVR